MIKESMPLKCREWSGEQNKNSAIAPFLLRPACKDYLWGGYRLDKEYGKHYGVEPLAETWECSAHPDGVSVVESGVFKGQPLDMLLKKYPELLGTHPAKTSGVGELPVLVKLIDAGEDASVQVHPDDEYARRNEPGEKGKTEMWYVLDADENAKLVYGFCQDMNHQMIKTAVENRTLEKYLRKVKVCKDDVFYIEPGQVHAIGAGIILAEIQQNSNVTYRLYDYNRVDKNGKRRELHLEKSLDVARLDKSTEPRQPMRVLKYRPGCAIELLCRCKYFQVERILIHTTQESGACVLEIGEESFCILLCLEGEGMLDCVEGIKIEKGDCVFVPANSGILKLEGKMQLLQVRC